MIYQLISNLYSKVKRAVLSDTACFVFLCISNFCFSQACDSISIEIKYFDGQPAVFSEIYLKQNNSMVHSNTFGMVKFPVPKTDSLDLLQLKIRNFSAPTVDTNIFLKGIDKCLIEVRLPVKVQNLPEVQVFNDYPDKYDLLKKAIRISQPMPEKRNQQYDFVSENLFIFNKNYIDQKFYISGRFLINKGGKGGSLASIDIHSASIFENKRYQRINVVEIHENAMTAFFQSLDFIKNLERPKKYNLNYVGKMKVEGRTCYRLVFSPSIHSLNERNMLYKGYIDIDSATHHILRLDRKYSAENQNRPISYSVGPIGFLIGVRGVHKEQVLHVEWIFRNGVFFPKLFNGAMEVEATFPNGGREYVRSQQRIEFIKVDKDSEFDEFCSFPDKRIQIEEKDEWYDYLFWKNYFSTQK